MCRLRINYNHSTFFFTLSHTLLFSLVFALYFLIFKMLQNQNCCCQHPLTSGHWDRHPLFPYSLSFSWCQWWWRLWIKEILMRTFLWIWFWVDNSVWWTIPHTWPEALPSLLKGLWHKWDLTYLVASGCQILDLSRSILVMPAQLALPSSAGLAPKNKILTWKSNHVK